MGDLSWGEACFILSSFYVKNCEWVGWIKDERGVTLALRDDEGWDVGHVAEEAMA
jgi:hypothetical protein